MSDHIFYLFVVQINGDNVRKSGFTDELSEKLRGNGTSLSLFGLLSVGQVGQNSDDILCCGSLASVGHQEHLHDAVINISVGGRLNDVNISRTN